MLQPAAGHGTWILSDGRAGNVRQATALVSAMGFADARDVVLATRAPWRWCAPRTLPGSGLAFGDALAGTPPALAVGCGRQAALATRLLHRAGSRAVQILDPRIATHHWDLVVAPEHDGLRGDNVVALVGSLHPVDDGWLERARADFSILAPLPQPRTTLLVGGPGADAGLDDAGFDRALARLDATLRRDGGSLLATTSRRTPERWRQALRAHFGTVPGVRWFAPTDNAVADDNPYPGLLAWADRIVCTPDSVNMASEACATRVPVHVIAPQDTRGRLRRFHEALLARGRTRPLDDALATWEIEPLRETPRVAAEVSRRLGLGATTA